jgi:hypothetical protein
MKKSLLILVLILGARSEAFGQWVQTSGPYGGNVNTFAVMGAKLFAGTPRGIFVSIDSGVTWSLTNNGIPELLNVKAFAVNGENIFVVVAGSLYHSTDSGKNWMPVDISFIQYDINSIVFNNGTLFAGTEGGIYYSTDTGITWPFSAPLNVATNALVVAEGGVFAVASYGLYVTRNDGKSWVPADSGLNLSSGIELAVKDSIPFFSINDSIFRSIDSGRSWEFVSAGVTLGLLDCAGNESNLFAWGTNDTIFRSSDDGVSWSPVELRIASTSIAALASIGSVLVAGTNDFTSENGGGIYRSLDIGTNWVASSTGILNSTVPLLTSYGTKLLAAANGGGAFLSNDSGDTWASTGPPGSIVQAFVGNGTDLFMGTSDGLYRSTDSGLTWMEADSGLTSTGVISLGVHDGFLFAGLSYNGGVFRSSDSGSSWTSSGLQGILIYNIIANGPYLFAGTDRSSDNGTSWWAGSLPPMAVIGTNLFAGSDGGGVFRSTDSGTSWFATNAGLKYLYVYTLAVSSKNICASVGDHDDDNGLFFSTNFGSTWCDVTNGLPNLQILSVAFDSSNVYVGTDGAGIWRRSISDLPTLSYILDVKSPESDTIFFDTIAIGQTSLRTVTAFNAGNGALTIQPIQSPQNGFVTSDLSSPVILDSGESSTFEVYFQPTTPGLHSAELNLLSEAKEVTIYLSGFTSGEADVKNNSLQTDLQLSAYPNPLSQSTTIRFTSAESGVARVTVVNLLGEEVARVFEGALNAGEHNFLWSKLPGLPAGMYECIVEMNGSVQQVPIVVASEP